MRFKKKYILAETAEERIVALYRKEKNYSANIFNTAIDACQTIILDMYDNDSIDAVPVRHGEWIKMSDAYGTYYACSECGEELTRVNSFDRKFDVFPRIESVKKTNYCPHCGADMRGKEK